MQNQGKHSRPNQPGFGQQPGQSRAGAPRPQQNQPCGQPHQQRPYQPQQPTQQFGQQPYGGNFGAPQSNYNANAYGNRDYNFQPLPPSNHNHDGMIRVKKKRKKKRTGLIVAIVVIVCLIVGVGGYGAALALSAKDMKAQASGILSTVNEVQTAITGQDFAGAAQSATKLQASAKTLDEALSSPLWNVAGMIPVIGEDVKSAQTIADVLTDASDNAIVPLTQSLVQTPPSECIGQDGSLNITAISTLLGSIQSCAPTMQRCADELNALPSMHIEQLEKMLRPAKDKLANINSTFQQANTFAPIIGALLGADGNRTYLLAAQNSAEIRASGGFPGSMGTLSIDNGQIELGDFTKVYDMMVEDTPAQCNITDEENTLFYPWYTQYSWDNGFNPDYPRVASIWATAYQEKSGQAVDGVISITPTMVQDLLAATGESFTLSDGTYIDGANATEVLQHDLYWKYLSSGANMADGNDIVDALFSEAAGYAFDAALDNMNATSLMKLVNVMMGGLDDRRVMIWLANPTEQQNIEDMGYSGSMTAATQKQPTLGVFINYWLGSKLGWWLGMDTQVSGPVAGSDGSRTYHVTTTLTNFLTEQEALAGGDYIMSEDSNRGNMNPFLYFYAPVGGSISDVVASNGATLGKATYQGIDVTYTCDVDGGMVAKPNNPLPVGTTATFTYTVTLPADVQGDLQLVTTPTLTKYHES